MKLWLALLAGLLLCASASASASTFTFTAIPDQDETLLRERFDRIADYLSQQLNVEVNYVPVKSYAAAVTAFIHNRVQLAWFGGLSGVQARLRVPGSRAIAQGAEDRAFRTYFIAHASTGLEPSKELPQALTNYSFTFGSKGSTSGRLMPEYYLRERFGRPPREIFPRLGFSGDHSRTIALVQSGAYQLGAVNYAVWERELAAGTIDPSKVQVIWQTPPYPDYQWTLRADVDERWGAGFSDRVQKALLRMSDPQLLASFPRSRFIPARNADFEPIAKTARTLGLID